ncbi:uncharacterized protein CIMG_13123 [Coccidioides immitis RS]|uniref:Uncharacterized protein n=1 Tax=Coccidioides immitis (strain RS) TaxID=246410 RepID=A0A0D8JWM8_COCIM|nr:uncharacterized protein CIMG_13123 [Coccidioides immitis RS]KJF60678.1 hypothetical protein CIMG_13123 [Coccidioides immitis RS]
MIKNKIKTSQMQYSITAYKQIQFHQIIVKLEIKIITHDYNYLAASLMKDNNSLSVLEKMKKDDFKIVVFSNKNNKNNKMNDN